MGQRDNQVVGVKWRGPAVDRLVEVGIADYVDEGVSDFFFFFSSRRRHTRFDCDWSSDVCSSDLVSVELPLIICDIQRAGPSTGMPTKTEQADLLQAMFGRNGESPVPIVAPASPADCFNAAIEAARIAVKYRTPVFLLSDGYLANGSEPWRIPDTAGLPDLSQEFAFAQPADLGENGFEPFRRDPVTLARPWAIPGTPGLEHPIGGIEKADVTRDISYDPANHDRMVRLRQAKIAGIAADVPPVQADDP